MEKSPFSEGCELRHISGTRWELVDPKGRQVATTILDLQVVPPTSGSSPEPPRSSSTQQ